MEYWKQEALTGMFLLNGEGFFTGEEDIVLGEQFVETIANEGLHVDKIYGHDESGQQALLVKFTSEPNSVLI